MNKVFTDNGWKDYVYWQTEDRKALKKINSLIDDVCRNGNEGVGVVCSPTVSISGNVLERRDEGVSVAVGNLERSAEQH